MKTKIGEIFLYVMVKKNAYYVVVKTNKSVNKIINEEYFSNA